MIYIVPEVVIFEHADFMGLQRRFNVRVPDLSRHEAFINWKRVRVEDRPYAHNHDKISWAALGISSVMIISGTWKFYEYPNFRGGRISQDLGPGAYPYVERPAFNMPNDKIMSFEPTF